MYIEDNNHLVTILKALFWYEDKLLNQSRDHMSESDYKTLNEAAFLHSELSKVLKSRAMIK